MVALALTDTSLNSQSLDLSGPEALTHDQIAAELSKAAGREIRYESISDDSFRSALTDLNVPTEYIDLLAYLFDITRSGVNAAPTNDVERVLGRPAKSFAEFAARAAREGLLSPQEVSNG
ncbi:MAG: hypothetical protein H6815_00070 [Phycisphaeraceae bacterium]|nr:hypothetical protein [Phycisphaerales bacterium]MCB9858823.1 hypothetical protein [Phycisphaeraceae bacterium]